MSPQSISTRTHIIQMTKALELYNALFHRIQKHSPCILEWNGVAQRYQQNENYLKNTKFPYLTVWTVNVFFVACFIGFGSCVHVLFELRSWDMWFHVAMALLLASMSFLLWSTAIVFVQHTEMVISGTTNFQSLISVMHKDIQHSDGFQHYSQRLPRFYWTFMSNVAKCYTYILFILAITFSFVLLTFNIDPFWYTFPKILSETLMCGQIVSSSCNFVRQLVIVVLRSISVIICVFEACRFYPVLFNYLLYLLEHIDVVCEYLRALSLIFQNDTTQYHRDITKWLNTLQICMSSLALPVFQLTALLMGSGFVIYVGCNVVTVRYFRIFPPVVICFTLTISILCTFLVYFLLQLSVLCNKNTHFILAELSRNTVITAPLFKQIEFKIARRKNQALKPTSMYCGSFYALQRGAELSYYAHVCNRTLDGILLAVKF